MKQDLPHSSDTIAAIATPPGKGGVGIVRISGTELQGIAKAILGVVPEPRHAYFGAFYDADKRVLDQGIAIYFPAPNSFTGEDVLELQGHGGPVILDLLLDRCLGLGARLARPGEFSERAFLNDKIDLTQAEAIADLIESGSTQAARSALRSLQGEFSREVETTFQALTELRVYVESALDFPEEEIDFLATDELMQRMQKVRAALQSTREKAQQGNILREGLHLVIVGQPNAGKSSLLNRLAGYDAAIVTDIPGTTRDVLRENIQIEGLPVHIVDTAGLRESEDPVEKEGIRRAWAEIEKADAVLVIVDGLKGQTVADDKILKQLPERLPVLRVVNKRDLMSPDMISQDESFYISAKTGEGIKELTGQLILIVGYQSDNQTGFMARRRHIDALNRAYHYVELAAEQLKVKAGELVAEELSQAQEALGTITGRVTSDELLGKIFSSFCIGK